MRFKRNWQWNLATVLILTAAVIVGCSEPQRAAEAEPRDSKTGASNEWRAYRAEKREPAPTVDVRGPVAQSLPAGVGPNKAVDGNDTILLPEHPEVRFTREFLENNPSRRERAEEATRRSTTRLSEQLGANAIINPRHTIPSSSLPHPSEELWIISRTKQIAANVVDDNRPRTGALIVQQADKIIPCPLKHTDVKARVDGFIASVDVVQQFHNPFFQKIEASYVFPLPENAAVNEFVMTIGNRVIRGIIREKEEAKQIYEAAKQQGHVAALLEQDRPNVFTQKVANIEPGKQIDISIRYFHTLAYVDGSYELVFPMVVGPRFNPPGSSSGIGAVRRDAAPGASGQATQVSYLAPGERTGSDISLSVDLNAGVTIEQIDSINHAIDVKFDQKAHAQVAIKSSDRIPNKDFVLRYKVAGETLKSGVIVQRDSQGGGYFALMLYPPASTKNLTRRPVDLCFTLDVSGSMTGSPIEQSKNAIRAALSEMRETDTFQIVRFAGSTDQMTDSSVPATKENIRRALKFIDQTGAGGGTMMLDGITRSLNQTVDENRVRYLCLLTDGFIGNEAELIKATRQMRGATRVFGFGVGSSPNRFLLDGMSRAGAGAVAYLSLNDKGEDVMQPFFERISHPALTNIQVDAGGLRGAQISPMKIPDVYVGRAAVVTGRFEGAGGTIKVRGNVDGQVIERTFDIAGAAEGTAIASVWARQQISAICDQAAFEGGVDLAKEVKQIALNYSLMSDYTSFVAVDGAQQTSGNHGISLSQPVPVPEGVRYETTVGQTGGDR